MKSLLLLSLLFLSLDHAIAQEEIRDHFFILGGSMSYQSQTNGSPVGVSFTPIGFIFSPNSNDSKSSSLFMSPYFGYELNPRMTLGVLLNYGTGNHTYEQLVVGDPSPVTFKRKSDRIGFGIFYRFIINPANRLNFYLQPSISYNTVKEKVGGNSILDTEEKVNFIEADLGAGAIYSVNELLHARIGFGFLDYFSGNWEDIGGTKKNFNTFRMSLSLLNISLGAELKL